MLEHRHDPSVVEALLAAHLRRLEQGVVDARRELSSVRTLLTSEDPPMTTLSIDATALADALRAVRFAVGSDPDFPVMCGVLLDVDVTVLSVDAHGRLRVGDEGTGVDVEFLLEAVDAGGPGQLWLELDGPLAPVTIRSAGSFSLLMPVRWDEVPARAADRRDRDGTVLAAAVVSLSRRSPAGGAGGGRVGRVAVLRRP